MMFASLITKLVSIGPTWYDVPVHQQVRLVVVAVFHKTEENVHATVDGLGRVATGDEWRRYRYVSKATLLIGWLLLLLLFMFALLS